MSDIQKLIDWAERHAWTIDENVMIERAQSELGIFQQIEVAARRARDHANGGL